MAKPKIWWLTPEGQRLKAQMDERARIAYARETGLAQARAEAMVLGERIGTIHAFQISFGLPETPSGELAELALDSLAKMADDLEQQYHAKKRAKAD